MSPYEFKELRRKTGLSQEGLARKMECSLRLITLMESGRHPIAAKYEFSLRWIVLTAKVEA